MRPTADQLSIIDAATEGTKAGQRMNGASMNPYQDGSDEYNAWENARAAYIGFALNVRVALAGRTC